MRRILAAVTLFVLAGCASASAATPVTLMPTGPSGGGVDIAVDASGRAHITAFGPSVDVGAERVEPVSYCQLPRGGAGCTNGETFVGAQPGDKDFTFGRPHVFLPSASNVTVFHERCCLDQTMVNVSGDGGSTFGSRTIIGDLSANPDEAVYGPGPRITALAETVTAGTAVQTAPVSGPQVTGEADLLDGISGEGAIGLDAEQRPVAVFIEQSDPHKTWWRKFTGPVSTANINNEANWSPPVLLASTDQLPSGPAMAGGPNGLFLFYEIPSAGGDIGFVRKFTGSAFGPAVKVTEAGDLTDFDLHQDPSGRLHAIWDNVNGASPLRWSTSVDGVNWTAPVDIHRESGHLGARVAAAADGRGFAVWDGGSNAVAVPLEALPPGGGPGGGTGGGTGGGPDTSSPTITSPKIGDDTLLPGQGTKFTFNSSEAGRAVLAFEKRVKGLKLKKNGRLRCLRSTRERLRKLRRVLANKPAIRRLSGKARTRKLAQLVRKRRCRAFKRVGAIRQQVSPGRNEISFTGRLAGRKLSPGIYRARLTVTDLAGNVSVRRTVKFRVISKKGRRG